MKTLQAILTTLFIAGISTAHGTSSVSFTNSNTSSGLNAFADIALGKFDSNLGTLTDVIVTVNFLTLDGSFTVQTSGAGAATLNSMAGRVTLQQSPTNSLGFTTIGAITNNVSSLLTPSLPATIAGGGAIELFTLTSPTNLIVGAATNISSGFWGAYQSLGGLGSVIFQVKNNPLTSFSGGSRNLDATDFTATANMTVTYNYTPTEPIPEPGTWAVGALLLGGAAYSVWRRRQNTAVEPAAAA